MVDLFESKTNEELFNENIELRKQNAILRENLFRSKEKECNYRRRLLKTYEDLISKFQ